MFTISPPLEDDSIDNEKMEIVARLAGGVAHDFNNALSVILLHNDMLLSSVGNEAAIRRHTDEIKMATARATTLTHQLLALGGKRLMHPRPLDLNDEVQRCCGLLQRVLGRKIELVVRLSEGVDQIDADAIHLEQVIGILVQNARDAMPGGGTLTISTGVFNSEPASVEPVLPTGSYARITISDNGTGMDETTRARMFEPFFTTKGGQGTGLGLSTVYGVVKQFGGTIFVHTELGQGTNIDIYLPHVAAVAVTAQPETIGGELPLGAELILVVDDEEMVRRATAELLQLYGYEVLEAESGSEALEICAETDEPIALLLADVSMPEMSGPELAKEIGLRWPAIHILLMSGSYAPVEDQAFLRDGTAVIEKPFNAAQLARRIRSIVTGNRCPLPSAPEASGRIRQ